MHGIFADSFMDDMVRPENVHVLRRLQGDLVETRSKLEQLDTKIASVGLEMSRLGSNICTIMNLMKVVYGPFPDRTDLSRKGSSCCDSNYCDVSDGQTTKPFMNSSNLDSSTPLVSSLSQFTAANSNEMFTEVPLPDSVIARNRSSVVFRKHSDFQMPSGKTTDRFRKASLPNYAALESVYPNSRCFKKEFSLPSCHLNTISRHGSVKNFDIALLDSSPTSGKLDSPKFPKHVHRVPPIGKTQTAMNALGSTANQGILTTDL